MKLTLVNMSSGAVRVHKAGCRDANKDFRAGLGNSKYTYEYESKFAAWADYNADFLAEGSGAYDLDFLACTEGLAEGEHEMSEAAFEEAYG